VNKNNTAVNLVHLNSTPGGIEVLLPGIIRGVREIDFRVFVIRSRNDTTPFVYDGLEEKISYGSRNNFIAIRKLFRFARRRRSEIFHLFNTGPLFIIIMRLAGAKRIIYSIHGTIYWHNSFEKISRLILWRFAMRGNDILFTANSEYSRDMFRSKISGSIKCKVLYNYFDQNRYAVTSDQIADDHVMKIIYVGRLAHGKGLDKWIDTAMKIHTVRSDIEFFIYGAGELDLTLRKKIDDSDATGYIQMMGYRADMDEVYRDADLLLFLSEYESFGNVVVESILSGVPVLVSDIPALREVLSDFPEFILSSSPDIPSQVLAKTVNMRVLREKASAARDIFRTRYSAERHFKSLTGFYERI
jgi:glycosyltransferase involved in cell wall biosynthesis